MTTPEVAATVPRAMRHLQVLLIVTFSVSAQSAEVTRVASSFEEKHPFGMYLDFTFDRLQDRGSIVREWHQGEKISDVTELRYAKYETKLGLDLHLGVYKDFELHVGVPIVFQQDRKWNFAAGTDASNTTLYRNCVNARGQLCTTPGQGTGRLFEMGEEDPASYRSGLGDFTFGLAWAPLVQRKDPSKPTWTLRVDYQAPMATTLNPSQPTSATSRGAIGDRNHRLTLNTALSKRLGAADHFVQLEYTLPWLGPASYSNCQDPSDERLGRAENCEQDRWTLRNTGVRAPHTAQFTFGTELTAFERANRHQRVVFDLHGWLGYVSEGRYYNELSDLLGKLLQNGDYGQMGAQIGFIGQAAEFVTLKASASLAYNTERVLTCEEVGRDLNGNGSIDVTDNPIELNPNFDNRIDLAGRRFRMEEQFLFRVLISAAFNF